jgi:hypothetical protein
MHSRKSPVFVMLRAATGVAAAMLLACVPGCAPQVAPIVPIGMAVSHTAESTTSTAMSSSAPEPDREGDTQRCAQLANMPPGIEEVRSTPDGAIESREIRLDESGPHPQWVVYRTKNSSPEGWRSQPRIARLDFVPPLKEALAAGESRFLVYAVVVADKPDESEKMVSAAENFGQQGGSFKWQSRVYRYTLVAKLPCFPGP